MNSKQYQHLFELLKKQRVEGFNLGIKEYIEATNLDLNVGPIHAKNISAIEGENPLCLAVKHWNLDLVKVMLDNGANPNYQNKEQPVNGSFLAASAIFYQTYCAEDKRRDMIKLMCDYGLNVNTLNHANENLLFESVRRVCIDNSDDYCTINYLIEKGIFLNHNFRGKSVLTMAINKKNEKLAHHLIDCGANAESLLKRSGHTEFAQNIANYYKIKKERDSLNNLIAPQDTPKTTKLKI
jgi:ankyrin repeat protein